MFNTYFSAKPILSKGALYNYVSSDRSDGKTFDCKFRALEDYDLGKYISIYMRRFKTEITQNMYETFFNEVLEKPVGTKYKNWQFKGCKTGVQVKKPESEKWDWIVYFIPLTMSGKLKSQLDISRIRNIDFDEYIPLDGRYATGEMTLINEFYKSIDRDREVVRFNFFGNKIAYFCPLLDYFKVDLMLNAKDTIRLYQEGTLAVQIYSCKEHRDIRKAGKLAKLMKGTDYENYNLGGVLQALDLKIEKHNEKCDCFASFKTELGEGTIWQNRNNDFIISCTSRADKLVIADNMYNLKNREVVLISFGRLASDFKQYYRVGKIKFESEKAFHLFEPLLKMIR